MLNPQNLSVPKVTRSGNIQNPSLWLARPAAQMILRRFPCTHNHCVAPSKLNMIGVQSANHFRDSRVVWLDVILVRQGRVQHAQTRLSNLTPLLWSAPIGGWPKERDGGDCAEQRDNTTTDQKNFADAFHVTGAKWSNDKSERWRRNTALGSANAVRPPPSAPLAG
jgi:hypothetical protein